MHETETELSYTYWCQIAMNILQADVDNTFHWFPKHGFTISNQVTLHLTRWTGSGPEEKKKND